MNLISVHNNCDSKEKKKPTNIKRVIPIYAN
jgi:hypothetical protein